VLPFFSFITRQGKKQFHGIRNKKKIWALIPSATLHCALGSDEWSIVLIDELVPEQHDLIPSLGRGLEQNLRG